MGETGEKKYSVLVNAEWKVCFPFCFIILYFSFFYVILCVFDIDL